MNKEIETDKFEEYKKKPITVQAYKTDKEVYIETLEGTMKANIGDYIIKGVKGEYYPCKPDVFNETYSKIEIAKEDGCWNCKNEMFGTCDKYGHRTETELCGVSVCDYDGWEEE